MKTNDWRIAVWVALLFAFCAYFTKGYSLNSIRPDPWYIHFQSNGQLDCNPANTRLAEIKGKWYAFHLDEGKIVVYAQDAVTNQWSIVHQFASADAVITSFHLCNNGGGTTTPEIIAGTNGPGFVLIYRLAGNDYWQAFDYGKYVWAPIQAITAARLNGDQKNYILAQNEEGYLYVLRENEASLDLVWRSVQPWRAIASFTAADFDMDGRDELVAVYKNGGMAVLKMVNTAVVSVWENYPWGKVLASACADWDNDGRMEYIFSTSQRMIYIMGFNDRGFGFEQQITQMDYPVEQIAVTTIQNKQLLVCSDTTGKLHFSEIDAATKRWNEILAYRFVRLDLMIPNPTGGSSLFLWQRTTNLTGTLSLLSPAEIQLRYENVDYPVQQGIICRGNQFYISMQFVKGFPSLQATILQSKDNYLFSLGEGLHLEFNLKDLSNVKRNGSWEPLSTPGLYINDDLYLSIETFSEFSNLHFSFDPVTKILEMKTKS